MIVLHSRAGEGQAWEAVRATTRLESRQYGTASSHKSNLPYQVQVGIIIASVLLLAGFVFLLVYFREVIFKSCLKGRTRSNRGRYPSSHFDYDGTKEGPMTPLSPLTPFSQLPSQYDLSKAPFDSRRTSTTKIPFSPPTPFSNHPSIRSQSTVHTVQTIKTVPYSSRRSEKMDHSLRRSASESFNPSYTKEVFVARDYIPTRPPPAITGMPRTQVHELAGIEVQRSPKKTSHITSENHLVELPDRTSRELSTVGSLQHMHSAGSLRRGEFSQLRESQRRKKVTAMEFISERRTSKMVELPAEPVIREENHEVKDDPLGIPF